MLKRPDFQISSTTQLILDLMTERMNGDNPLVTYLELEKLTGKTTDDLRNSVYTARRRIRQDYGKWYDNVPNIGYQVMADDDLPECGKENRGKARNLHRETLKILAIADPTKQSQQARTSTILERSIAELGMAATAPRAITKVEQMVSRSHNQLTLEEQVIAIKDALKR